MVAPQNAPQSAREASWHALRCKPGGERRVCIWMRLRGLEPYWARYRSETRLQRRDKMLWRSVMPGYLFLLSPVNYRMVEDAPDVYKFMRNGDGNVAVIGQGDIDKIKEIETALNDSAIAAAEGIPFKKGQSVRVMHLDLVCKIKRIDSRRRLVVDAPLFGSVVPLTVAVSDIESV